MNTYCQTGSTKSRGKTAIMDLLRIGSAFYPRAMNRIKELRALKGLSQDKLAELAGTNSGQIARLENGQRKLSQEWMNRLAPHLGVPPGEILPGPASGTDPALVEFLASPLSSGLSEELREQLKTMRCYTPPGKKLTVESWYIIANQLMRSLRSSEAFTKEDKRV
jgi:transcriptional regulator with XRE-family HTH domain